MSEKKENEEFPAELNSLIAYSYDPLKQILADLIKKQKNHDILIKNIVSGGVVSSKTPSKKPSLLSSEKINELEEIIKSRLGNLLLVRYN